MRDYYSSDDEYAGSEGIFDDSDMPEDWRFLFEWFEGLANRLSIADRARLDTSAADLGRDPATDWWIDVDHEVGFLVSDYDERDDEDRHMRYRRVCESLILQCIMAHVDYDDWIDELRRSTRFLPTKWTNLRNTVTQLREIEESHRTRTYCQDRETPPVPPVFRLECVALDCRHFMFHSTVLKEIQAIVETGIYIALLMLPGRYAPRSQEPAGALRVTWAVFVCAITGHPTKMILPCVRGPARALGLAPRGRVGEPALLGAGHADDCPHSAD